MIVPLEVVVTKGRIDRIPEQVDFGLLISPSHTVSAHLSLLNSGTAAATLTSAHIVSDGDRDNQASLVFSRNKVLPAGQTTHVATLSYAGHAEGFYSGTVILEVAGGATPTTWPSRG